MARIAIIENGLVANTIEAEPELMADLFPTVEWSYADSAGIGWGWNGTEFSPPPLPAQSPEEIQALLVNAVQAHLDAVARTRNYDGILSLASYATSTIPKFLAEGQAGVLWRDEVWAYCYGVLAQVSSGARAIPTADELVAELPPMNWGE